MSVAKLHFDLLRSRKDPFHHKPGAHSIIAHISQEAISQGGGAREGHSKVSTLLQSGTDKGPDSRLQGYQTTEIPHCRTGREGSSGSAVLSTPAPALIRPRAPLFFRVMITNKEAFDDQIN